tara:strand:+ start:225 stop:413 length:189 start_codon:yes stop_codon:yes gene_type:complete
MKVGDLVTVHPYAKNLYLVVRLMCEDKKTIPGNGRLWEMYDPETDKFLPMSEKFLEVLSESN